jgi:hypothetical protein
LKSVHQGNHCWTISFPPYMGPMSDVTMLWRLHRADFGHVMSSWHCHWPKVWLISARTKPIPKKYETSTPRNQHCLTTISFPPYGSNEWCSHMLWICQPSQYQRCFQPFSTPRKPLLDHFISSIWVQWVMLPCYEGPMGLILDMSCPLGNVSFSDL